MICQNNILQYNIIPSQGKLIALDLGTKRIGVATCDFTQNFATPLTIINRQSNEKDFAKIKDLIIKNNAKALIMGFPTHIDGKEIPMTDFVRKFSQNLDDFLIENKQEIIIFLEDERLSSFEAQEIAKEIPQRKKQKHFDDIAATIILESFLRQRNYNNSI